MRRVAEIAGACLIALVGALVLAYALGVYADARSDLRSDVSDIRTNPSPPPPAPAPAPSPSPGPAPSGGITNVTSGEAGSGGNSGGQVVTGDETVDVHVVNEGPTNSNTIITTSSGGITPPPPAPAPAPEPTCDPRSRTCIDGRGR